MSRKKLTASFVAKAPPPESGDRVIYWDDSLPGFGLQVTENGHRGYVFQYRAHGVSRRMKLNGGFLQYEAARSKEGTPKASRSALEAARWEARKAALAVRDGRDPLAELKRARAAESNSLRSVAEQFFAREGKTMRSLDERQAIFRRHIFDRFGARPVSSIRRSEIVRLLDKVADESGPVAAEHVLVALRRLFNWYAKRDDDFLSPIVRGMLKRGSTPRDRVLDDVELRAIWAVSEQRRGPYDYLIQFILLTATRLREASDLRRVEFNDDGSEWLIPGARYKTKLDHILPLSEAARRLLADMPVIGRKGWVFTTNGEKPISGFSKFKAEFDRRVIEEQRRIDPDATSLPRWTTHDLRRTARTLMARAGVPADAAERALGHVIGGVRGVYDRHAYKDEKRTAFEALAAQIVRIVHPQDNVVPIGSRR